MQLLCCVLVHSAIKIITACKKNLYFRENKLMYLNKKFEDKICRYQSEIGKQDVLGGQYAKRGVQTPITNQ